MKKGSKIFIITEAVLAVLVCLVAITMLWERRGRNLDQISVIVADSDDTQWSAFKYGLRMAAEDNGVELFFVSTGEELTVEEQQRLIQTEIDNGADAVIVQPLPGAEEMLLKLERKLPVMLIGYAPEEDGVSDLPAVAPDNYGMGTALAEELLEDNGGNLEGKKLGILLESTASQAVLDRKQGFQDTVKKAGASVIWSVETGASGEWPADMTAQPEADCVAALDDASLTAAGAYSSSNDLQGARVYGIGHSTEAAYYLDTGAVECLIVPDEFNVGYQSLTEAASQLRELFYRMRDRTVSYTAIRQEELFTKENQEILFTMSQ